MCKSPHSLPFSLLCRKDPLTANLCSIHLIEKLCPLKVIGTVKLYYKKSCFYAKTPLYLLSIVYSYPRERKRIMELIRNKSLHSQLNSIGICPQKSNFESYHRKADEIIPNWVCKKFQLTCYCVTQVTLKLCAIPLCF